MDRHELHSSFVTLACHHQGGKISLTETTVDAANKLIHHSTQVLIFLHITSTWDGDLHQDDLSNPFWVLVKEDLESVELLRDTLDVIQAVDTDDKFHALKLLFELGDTLLNRGLRKPISKLLRIDTDGERADCTEFALILYAIRGRIQLPAIKSARLDSKQLAHQFGLTESGRNSKESV